jgi:hypothetical protein
MRMGEIRDAEKVRNRVRPLFDKGGNKFLSSLGEITGIYWRQWKALGIELQIPDHMLRIDRQRAQRNAAGDRVKFIEVVAGPSHRALATHHPHNFKHLRLRCRPARIQRLPR